MAVLRVPTRMQGRSIVGVDDVAGGTAAGAVVAGMIVRPQEIQGGIEGEGRGSTGEREEEDDGLRTAVASLFYRKPASNLIVSSIAIRIPACHLSLGSRQ